MNAVREFDSGLNRPHEVATRGNGEVCAGNHLLFGQLEGASASMNTGTLDVQTGGTGPWCSRWPPAWRACS